MFSKFTLTTCVILLASTSTVVKPGASVGEQRAVSWQEHMRLVDLVFPRPHYGRDTRFIMVLRYLPSFHPEVQIALTDRMDSEVQVEQRTLRKRLQGVEAETGFGASSHDPELLGRMSGLDCRGVSVTPELVNQWLEGFFSSLQTSAASVHQRALERTIILDGTVYMLDLETGADHLSFGFSGSEIDTGGPHEDIPLVRWMNSIREQVARLPAP